MAGHSKFKNIQHRKGAQDKKRAKVFTRILREVSLAAKENPSSDENPKLRKAILLAKYANIPNDKIEYAVHKESKKDLTEYSDIQYEAFFPGGIGFIIEVSTDNKNRSSSEVRSVLSKNGANMVETGNVNFMFDNVGIITLKELNVTDIEKMMILDVEDIDTINEEENLDDQMFENQTIVVVKLEKFHEILEKLYSMAEENSDFMPIESKLCWIPHNKINVDENTLDKVRKLIDHLENLDHVVNVWCNV